MKCSSFGSTLRRNRSSGIADGLWASHAGSRLRDHCVHSFDVCARDPPFARWKLERKRVMIKKCNFATICKEKRISWRAKPAKTPISRFVSRRSHDLFKNFLKRKIFHQDFLLSPGISRDAIRSDSYLQKRVFFLIEKENQPLINEICQGNGALGIRNENQLSKTTFPLSFSTSTPS